MGTRVGDVKKITPPATMRVAAENIAQHRTSEQILPSVIICDPSGNPAQDSGPIVLPVAVDGRSVPIAPGRQLGS